jgi:hypothetical protein
VTLRIICPRARFWAELFAREKEEKKQRRILYGAIQAVRFSLDGSGSRHLCSGFQSDDGLAFDGSSGSDDCGRTQEYTGNYDIEYDSA